VKSPLFVRRAMPTLGVDQPLPPAAIVCTGKDVFHIVGFSTDSKTAFRRKIKRLVAVVTL
jgi:hypothetical protein